MSDADQQANAVARQVQNTLASINKSLDALTAAVTAQTAALSAVLPGTLSSATSATAGSATLPSAPAGFLNGTLKSTGAAIKIPYYNP